MKIALIAEKDTATCFKLSGLKDVYPVRNAEEAANTLAMLLEDSNLAFILVTERLIDQIRHTVGKTTERKYPMIIPIPDTLGPAEAKTDFVVELIRRKAGIEVKL